MPIPADSCPPGTTPDVCCNTLFLIGDRIRTVACEAVMCCASADCDSEFRSYTTVGSRIQDLVGDSVVVTLQNATTAATTNTARQRTSPTPVTRATYQVELRENGWPQAKARGKGIAVPDPLAVNAAAAHAMSHAELMYGAIANGATTQIGDGALFPVPTNPHIIMNSVQIGPLLPVGPQAYQIAWTIQVTVDAVLRRN
jgi:hypothetical protein